MASNSEQPYHSNRRYDCKSHYCETGRYPSRNAPKVKAEVLYYRTTFGPLGEPMEGNHRFYQKAAILCTDIGSTAKGAPGLHYTVKL